MADFHYIPVRTITDVSNSGEIFSAWNVNETYNAFTIVENSGDFYLSIDNVPSNILLTNPTYWKKISSTNEYMEPATNAQILNIFN